MTYTKLLTAALAGTLLSVPLMAHLQPAPGHLTEPTANPALQRNAALIAKLERASSQRTARILTLVKQIEALRVARGGEPDPPPPPPPPPPYIELATIQQQTEHIANLKNELIRQKKVIDNLERELLRLRRQQ
jgi:hypothetical protein